MPDATDPAASGHYDGRDVELQYSLMMTGQTNGVCTSAGHYALVSNNCYSACRFLEEKKRSEETQTLRAGCSNAEPEIFAPPQTPFPGARDGQNLISWRWSLPFTYKLTIDARNFELSW